MPLTLDPPIYWISESVISITSAVFNILILHSECKKRRQNDIKYTTKWLKLFSMICIISGTIYSIYLSVSHLPMLCEISTITTTMTALQFIAMGLYQLSRLHYCFANSKVHSNKGYPKWIFIAMYLIGIVNGIQGSLTRFIWNSVLKCGINNNMEFYNNENENIMELVSYRLISYSVYTICDIQTVLMYIFKAY